MWDPETKQDDRKGARLGAAGGPAAPVLGDSVWLRLAGPSPRNTLQSDPCPHAYLAGGGGVGREGCFQGGSWLWGQELSCKARLAGGVSEAPLAPPGRESTHRRPWGHGGRPRSPSYSS